MKGYGNENFLLKKKVGMLVLSSVCFCLSKICAVSIKNCEPGSLKLLFKLSWRWLATLAAQIEVLRTWPWNEVTKCFARDPISRFSPESVTMMQNSSNVWYVWYVGPLLATTQWIPPGKTHSFQPALVVTITSWASCTGTAPPVKAKLSKSQFMLARTKNVINPKIQTTKSKSKTENSFPNSFWCTCNWSVSDSSNSKKAAARLRIQQDASPLNKFALKLRINFQEETPKWCTLKYTTFPFLYFLLPNPKAKLNPSKSPQPPTKGGYIQPHSGSWWPWVDSFQ